MLEILKTQQSLQSCLTDQFHYEDDSLKNKFRWKTAFQVSSVSYGEAQHLQPHPLNEERVTGAKPIMSSVKGLTKDQVFTKLALNDNLTLVERLWKQSSPLPPEEVNNDLTICNKKKAN